MKTILVAAAVLVTAAPALAQSDPGMLSRVQVGVSNSVSPATTGSTRRQARGIPSPGPEAVVDENGHVIGADPDLNIRMQLHREHDEGF